VVQKTKTAPLLRNIYSTNAELSIDCDWVINRNKEIKWIKFSPDDRFLFVADSNNVTLYDLNHHGTQCSISHEDNVTGVRFPDDNSSFALIFDISDEYSIRRYNYEGFLLASSNATVQKHRVSYRWTNMIIGNSTISWPERGDHDKLVLNLYDYYMDRYVIKGLTVRKLTENYEPISIHVRLEIRKLFLIMQDPRNEAGQVIVIDIDSQHIVNECILQEVGRNHQVSNCGSYLATYTENGELWFYDLQSKERNLILTIDRFHPAKIIPMGRSSFICTGPPKGNPNGHEQVIYDIHASASVAIKVVDFSSFQVSDDLKHLMEVHGSSLSIWDVSKSEISGKFAGSNKLDTLRAKLSSKGNYIVMMKNNQSIFVFKREKLSKTTKHDRPWQKFRVYPNLIDDTYLMYKCTETEISPWKSRSYYKLLKLSGSNRTGENKQQYISEKATQCDPYGNYAYLNESGYLISFKRETKLYFYSIETGEEVLSMDVLTGFGGLVIIENVAISENGDYVAVLSSTGLLKIYDTGYLKKKKYESTITLPRCIRRIRVAPRSQKITAKFTKFITDGLIFVGLSNGHVLILEIASSKVISQNSIDKIPGSIHIIDKKTILVVSKGSEYSIDPKRLYLWDYIENKIKPLTLVIDGEVVYDFSNYRLSAQAGVLVVVVNEKGVYAINLKRIDDIKRIGNLGYIYRPGSIKFFGLFEILLEQKKLVIIDVEAGKEKDDHPKKRIRIWDINSWKSLLDDDTFLEEYDDIEIVSGKYIALWSKEDDWLKLYDLKLNLLAVNPILDFSGVGPLDRVEGTVRSWGPDKVITIGSDLNIFQII
jgi:WD40 repeat protein